MNTVAAIVNEDPSITIHQLSHVLDLSYVSIYSILTQDLDMRRRCCTWVPHHLTGEQMATRVEACNEWLRLLAEDTGFYNKVITCDAKLRRKSTAHSVFR